jgi:hypothetical protein
MGLTCADSARWPKGVIPYAFADQDEPRGVRVIGGIRAEGAFPSHIKQAIFKAMKRWEQLTGCIHFVPWRDEADYVLIKLWAEAGGADADCVGRRTIVKRSPTRVTPGGGDRIGGQIIFTISGFDPSNPGYPTSFKSIPHELGHVIGLEHEHYRSGSKLIPGSSGFESDSARETVARAKPPRCVERGGYDIKSIMHYECARGFVWHDKVPPPGFMNMPREEEVIAGTWSPSQGDISAVRQLYSGPGP